jgi:hypothetical protein
MHDRAVPFVVSCLSEGLLLVDGARVTRLDAVPSAGLAAGPLVRAVHDPAETARGGRLDLSDRSLGVAGLRDAHEIDWDRGLLASASTLANAVLWNDGGGRVVRRWNAPGEGDCWHLSGLCAAGGRVLVSAFGSFGRHRDWAGSSRRGAGLVVEAGSGTVVAAGLDSPHSPRLVDGALVVCDSGRGDLLVGGRRVNVGGWARGLAVTPAVFIVGVSARRGEPGSASLAVVRRSDLAVTGRIPLPSREVFSVVEAAEDEARATARPDEPRAAGAGPLRPPDLRAGVAAPAGLRLAPGALADVLCTVTNLGSDTFAVTAPHPVALVADWGSAGRALWSPLPEPIGPGRSIPVTARVLAPEQPGRHALELRLVQEGVAWLEGTATTEVTVE